MVLFIFKHGQLKLTGRNLGRVFNQLLGSLQLAFALPDVKFFIDVEQTSNVAIPHNLQHKQGSQVAFMPNYPLGNIGDQPIEQVYELTKASIVFQVLIELMSKYSSQLLRCMHKSGNTKGGSITVPLTSCLTGLDQYVLQIKTKIVSCHTADSKPVKQEVNSTMILPHLVFPA